MFENTYQEFEACPACSGVSFVNTVNGCTCKQCGLVVDERKNYVMNNGSFTRRGMIVKTHEVFNANVGTMVGYAHERRVTMTVKLNQVQSAWVGYQNKKKSRFFNEAKRIVHALQLPENLVPQAIFLHDKVAHHVPPRTRLAGSAVLAAVTLFYTAKTRGVALFKSELLKISGIDPKTFNSCVMRFARIVKEHCPALMERCQNWSHVVISQAAKIIRELTPDWKFMGVLKEVHSKIARFMMGLNGPNKIGTVVFFTVQVLGIGIPMSRIAKSLKCIPSSVHNAVKRVILKANKRVDAPLSKLDLGLMFGIRAPDGAGARTGNTLKQAIVQQELVA
ncbi:MAG: cyclin family protein [Promethearchaeota archaeon]